MYIVKTRPYNIGIEWSDKGVTRIQFLPQSVKASQKTLSGKIPKFVKDCEKALLEYFENGESSFSKIPVDFKDASHFFRDVWTELRKVKSAEVMTYGELALRVGRPKAARAIGMAMAKNPMPLIIPCHRVVGTQKKLVGFSAPGGVRTKEWLLSHEGCQLF